ncbi:hypothetical protein EJ04DRAFT_22144 [Polyplosphaeria fusca]|uniref:C2H2-type domain-containing protein n=1 Tax=Polyplosphaeria fusca TaxID=682080 RepID=A0A9P4QU32_9PLEO|nr:hypothetical protein EJ04DRAFT_22144 [Polyplosphaeria fusca]
MEHSASDQQHFGRMPPVTIDWPNALCSALPSLEGRSLPGCPHANCLSCLCNAAWLDLCWVQDLQMYLGWYSCRCGNLECSKSFARLAFLLAEIAKGPDAQPEPESGHSIDLNHGIPGLFGLTSPGNFKMEREKSTHSLVPFSPSKDPSLMTSIAPFESTNVGAVANFSDSNGHPSDLFAPPLKRSDSVTATKRRHTTDAKEKAPSDTDSHKRKRFKIDRDSDAPPRRLRCPYYQRDPEAHSRYSCRGSGFADMAKLKDHLKRAHTRPLRCTRCWENMSSSAALDAHLRAESICRNRPEPDDERICPRKLRDLNFNRSPFSSAETVEEKWQMLYKIIYPGDEDVPSAYEETDGVEKEMGLLASKIEEEVCKLLRPILGDVVDFLKGMVMAVVQECGEKILGGKREKKTRRRSSMGIVALDADLNATDTKLIVSPPECNAIVSARKAHPPADKQAPRTPKDLFFKCDWLVEDPDLASAPPT